MLSHGRVVTVFSVLKKSKCSKCHDINISHGHRQFKVSKFGAANPLKFFQMFSLKSGEDNNFSKSNVAQASSARRLILFTFFKVSLGFYCTN